MPFLDGRRQRSLQSGQRSLQFEELAHLTRQPRWKWWPQVRAQELDSESASSTARASSGGSFVKLRSGVSVFRTLPGDFHCLAARRASRRSSFRRRPTRRSFARSRASPKSAPQYMACVCMRNPSIAHGRDLALFLVEVLQAKRRHRRGVVIDLDANLPT